MFISKLEKIRSPKFAVIAQFSPKIPLPFLNMKAFALLAVTLLLADAAPIIDDIERYDNHKVYEFLPTTIEQLDYIKATVDDLDYNLDLWTEGKF